MSRNDRPTVMEARYSRPWNAAHRLSPVLRAYVHHVAGELGEATPLLFMQSSGGLTAADAFRGKAFMARIAGVVLDERHAEPIRLAQAADGDVGRGGIDDAAGFGGESLAGLGEQRVLSESQKEGEHDLSPIRDGPIRSSSRG